MNAPSADSGHLRRALRLPHATALVVGTIIGSAVFVQASEVTHHVPDLTGVLLVWTVSGILTLFGALACAELASAFPRTGGVYVFLREIYTPLAGFLWGWAMFWVMHSGIIAAMSMVFARYAGVFVALDDAGTRAVAVSAILATSAINYAGVKRSSRLQTGITAAKVLAVVLIVVVGFALGARLPAHAAPASASLLGGLSSVHPSEFLLAVVAGLFAFGGWHVVTYTAEETVAPERTIPQALGIGIAIVTVAYVALNAVYSYILPVERILSSTRVAADAAAVVIGPSGSAAISAIVMFSVFGAMMGSVLAAPRVYFATEQRSRFLAYTNFGWPFETSLAMSRLAFGGVLDRCPNLKIITHHAGGLIPYFHKRVELSWDFNVERMGYQYDGQTLTRRPVDYYRMFYCDTAIQGNTPALMCAWEFFGPDHMVFGTDMPYDNELGARLYRETLPAVEAMQIDAGSRRKIFSENARRLFRLAE